MTEFAARQKSVFVVDDHPIVRQGLVQLIEQEPDLKVCGEAADVKEARASLAKVTPDIVILDLSLRDSDGLELVKDIRSKYAQLPVLVLSMHDESIYAERLLSAGAQRLHHETSRRRSAAGRGAARARWRHLREREVGASMIERFAVSGRVQSANPIDRFSNREVQVLNLIGRGKTTREIADNLNLSVKTVESHRQRIKKKLNLHTAPQFVQFAVNWYSGHH